jgi:thioredoxin-related protein
MSDETEKFNGVVMLVTLAICGLLFWNNPPDETRQAAKPVRDPVTGIEVSGRAVIMITKVGCPPCERMKRETLPVAKESGYEIHTEELPAEQYPTTRIFDGRRWQTRVGFFRWGR